MRGTPERVDVVQPAPGELFEHGVFATVEEDWPAAEVAQTQRVAETGEGWLDVSG